MFTLMLVQINTNCKQHLWTAGVFLIVRCSPIFEYAPNILMIVTIFGGVTAFFAATSGAFQNDLKRVIAYSTCSQLLRLDRSFVF